MMQANIMIRIISVLDGMQNNARYNEIQQILQNGHTFSVIYCMKMQRNVNEIQTVRCNMHLFSSKFGNSGRTIK